MRTVSLDRPTWKQPYVEEHGDRTWALANGGWTLDQRETEAVLLDTGFFEYVFADDEMMRDLARVLIAMAEHLGGMKVDALGLGDLVTVGNVVYENFDGEHSEVLAAVSGDWRMDADSEDGPLLIEIGGTLSIPFGDDPQDMLDLASLLVRYTDGSRPAWEPHDN